MKLSLLKTLFLGILLLIASTVLLANTALSSPSSQQMLLFAQAPTEPQIEEIQPLEPPLLQESSSPETESTPTKTTSTDSQTTTEQGASEKSPSETTSDSDRSQSAGPYDMEAIKAFNRALYGS
jgi:hypothetical protein